MICRENNWVLNVRVYWFAIRLIRGEKFDCFFNLRIFVPICNHTCTYKIWLSYNFYLHLSFQIHKKNEIFQYRNLIKMSSKNVLIICTWDLNGVTFKRLKKFGTISSKIFIWGRVSKNITLWCLRNMFISFCEFF